jgi:hypothetical protein
VMPAQATRSAERRAHGLRGSEGQVSKGLPCALGAGDGGPNQSDTET